MEWIGGKDMTCHLRGGCVRIRPERELLWDRIFGSHYCASPEDKIKCLISMFEEYECPRIPERMYA